MALLEFLQFPLDIKTFILSYITRQTDLRSLCLVSHELRTLAVPSLYRRVALTVGGDQDLLVSAMLGRDNPGLNYIREISIHLMRTHLPTRHLQYDEYDSSEDEEGFAWGYSISARQAHFIVRLLLDLLPADILEIFRWETREPFSAGNWILLAQRQRKLRTIEVSPTREPLMPRIRKEPNMIQNLRNIDSLNFSPDSVDKLEVCQILLEANPGVQNLYLASGLDHLGEGYQDKSTGAGIFSLTLFGHLFPFDTCITPLVLKGLCIDKIDLSWAGDTYLKLLRLHCLETLEIVNCKGADNFFAAISKLSLRPLRLKTLRWIQGKSTDSHSGAAFEGFLEVAPMLHALHFDVHHLRSLPKVAALTRHWQTLKSLSIHGYTPISHTHITYNTKHFDDICRGCPKLRQLAIAFPVTNVDCTGSASNFDFYLRCIRRFRQLTCLNIRHWPIMRELPLGGPNGRLKYDSYDYYEHQLQRIAQRTFEACDDFASECGFSLGNRSCLSVIAFGGNGRSKVEYLQDEIELKQVAFVRGTQIDAFGNSGVLAVKTEWHMVQFAEPESEILNHSLYNLHNVYSVPL